MPNCREGNGKVPVLLATMGEEASELRLAWQLGNLTKSGYAQNEVEYHVLLKQASFHRKGVCLTMQS
jgi:hypothetical protein